jgi:hypothetical protein
MMTRLRDWRTAATALLALLVICGVVAWQHGFALSGLASAPVTVPLAVAALWTTGLLGLFWWACSGRTPSAFA